MPIPLHVHFSGLFLVVFKTAPAKGTDVADDAGENPAGLLCKEVGEAKIFLLDAGKAYQNPMGGHHPIDAHLPRLTVDLRYANATAVPDEIVLASEPDAKQPYGKGIVELGVWNLQGPCYLRSDGPLVAALGVEDLVVIAASDVVLVTRRDRDQDVNKLVARLRANGHRAATETPAVHRPWGYYQSVHSGERFQVKRITVNPGAKLSLQMHYHRAEHWVVVNGTALVTRDDETVLLRENESIFVPLGCTHRLENPGKMPLNLIEVQSGPYLGEDDIVRIEDVYRRV